MKKNNVFFVFLIANFQLDLEAGKVRWMLHDPDRNNNFTVVSDAVIASDEWVHIAGTYNATTSEAKIFINAKEMANATITGDGKSRVILIPDDFRIMLCLVESM